MKQPLPDPTQGRWMPVRGFILSQKVYSHGPKYSHTIDMKSGLALLNACSKSLSQIDGSSLLILKNCAQLFTLQLSLKSLAFPLLAVLSSSHYPKQSFTALLNQQLSKISTYHNNPSCSSSPVHKILFNRPPLF